MISTRVQTNIDKICSSYDVEGKNDITNNVIAIRIDFFEHPYQTKKNRIQYIIDNIFTCCYNVRKREAFFMQNKELHYVITVHGKDSVLKPKVLNFVHQIIMDNSMMAI
jgi:predicted nucleic-acid-binding protein